MAIIDWLLLIAMDEGTRARASEEVLKIEKQTRDAQNGRERVTA